MLAEIKKAVFFGAHTDDEMICAGTLHLLVRSSVEVHVVTFAPAAIESDRRGGSESVEVVYREWVKSMRTIGVAKCHFNEYLPSADFSLHSQKVCQFTYDWCEAEKPDLVFTLSPDDENTAHSIVGVECERVTRGRVPITLRCQFPWNYSIGRSNLYVKLEPEDLEVKRKVIDCYKSQHFRYRYGEMLLNYVRADGLSVKVEAAEKFELIRGVV